MIIDICRTFVINTFWIIMAVFFALLLTYIIVEILDAILKAMTKHD